MDAEAGGPDVVACGAIWAMHALLWTGAWSGWVGVLYERHARRAGLGQRELHPPALDSPRARATMYFNILGPAAALGFLFSPWAMALAQATACVAALATVRVFGLRLKPAAMIIVLSGFMAMLAILLLPRERLAQPGADSACRTWPSPRTT